MSQVTENKVVAAPVPMTPLQEFWHYFKRNKGAVVGLAYVAVMIIIAVFANFLAPYNPADQFRDALLAPPFWQEGGSMSHLLGTDDVGRDILSRLMYGARLSLLVGCLVVVLSLILGVVLGLVAGYFGGVIDSVIMRVVDIMLALPSLLLALVLVAIFGPSIVNASIALTFVALPHYVRLTRAAVLDVTIQAQIIELLLELQQKENMALILITHDLALVAEAAHKIIVMYAGQVVETGDAKDIFRAPRHPYTQALLRALPEFAQDKARLASLPGVVPGKYDRPNGCLLNPRCPYATDKCRSEEPELNLLNGGRQSKCHYPLDDAGRPGL